MKLSPSATSRLLHLLLLADLLVSSWSRPAHSPSLAGMFRSMNAEVENLIKLCNKLHEQSDDQLQLFEALEFSLPGLPHFHHTGADLASMKVNESLAQLYLHTQSFKLHMDWLQTAKQNVSMSSQAAEAASAHLLTLSHLLTASLQQVSDEVPEPPPPAALPVVSSAFDALKVSIEIAERLRVFCYWSKHVLRGLQRRCRN